VKSQELVSKKCEYALRAIFELARTDSKYPTKIQDIASAQGIPPRFLEVILVELKHGGFVLSKRGNSGGYVLARESGDITVGEVIQFFQGGRKRASHGGPSANDRVGDLAFLRLWERAYTAISEVYGQTTFENLVQDDIASRSAGVPNYVI